MTSLMISISTPLPAHRPWSGGSSENWLPPLARRWFRWLRPSKEVSTLNGPALETPTPAATGAVFTLAAVCWIDRLRLTPFWLWELTLPAASPRLGPNSGCPKPASAPSAVGLYEVVPAEGTGRVEPTPLTAPAMGATATVPAKIAATRATKGLPSLR